MRRVHAAQKDDDIPPLEEIILPLEAEIKFLRQEVYCYSFFFFYLNNNLLELQIEFSFDITHFTFFIARPPPGRW